MYSLLTGLLLKKNSNQVIILKELFTYLFSDTTPSSKLRTLTPERRAHIKKKIEANFTNPKSVSVAFTNNLPNVNLIERFVQDQIKIDDQPLINLVDNIQTIYMRLKDATDVNVPVQNQIVFDDITKELIKPYNLSAEFLPAAKSVVLYIFELCDIGKIPDDDFLTKPKPLSSSTLLDEKN